MSTERLRDGVAAIVGRRLRGVAVLVAMFVAVGYLAKAVLG
jgi:hypothetical protein